MSTAPTLASEIRHEFEHLAGHWWWLALLGVLMVVGGTIAIVSPAVMLGTSLIAPLIIGVVLMVEGVAMIIGSFWAGKWSGFLLELLAGILYIACGFLFTANPAIATLTLTVFIAVSFIVLGIFRTVAALMLRFPQWGWALLNGVITFVAGVVIYRNLPETALWVIGLLVGLELLFHGWMWLMMAVALRRIHKRRTAAA
jgi:uncharacterized membrane protein HdeD (DUF308 family)